MSEHIKAFTRHARAHVAEGVWTLGRFAHGISERILGLGNRIWDLSDWINPPEWSPFDDNGQLRNDLQVEGWHRVGRTGTEEQQ